jgi:YVTN family beta-propeller protein
MKPLRWLPAVFVLMLDFGGVSLAQHVIAKIPHGGGNLQMAVNPKTNMVYGPDASGQLYVIDGATNKVVTNIPVGNGSWNAWVYVPANLIYVGNVADHTVSIVDGNTNKVISTVPVSFDFGGIADGEVVGGNLLYVSGGATSTVHVVDLKSLTVLTDIPVTSAGAMAINPSAHLLYVAAQLFVGDASLVTVIDTTTNTVVNTFSAGDAQMAVTSMSVDPIHNELYASTVDYFDSNQYTVVALDATTGALLGRSVPLGTINQVLALPQQQKIAATGGKVGQGQGTFHDLIFIDGLSFGVYNVVTVGRYPNTVAFNPTTKQIYAGTLGGGLTVVGD